MQQYKTVSEFMDSLSQDKKTQVEALRSIIKHADADLEEHIKWNAPSYTLDGEDRITFNLVNKQGLVKVILHMGATRKEDKKAGPVMADDSGLIEWSSDIRGMLTFQDIQDVASKQEAISRTIKQWLSIKV